jgi:hypothetical protein
MAKYEVSLGALIEPTHLEAPDAKHTLKRVLESIDEGGLAFIPREDRKMSYWNVTNLTSKKVELTVKDTVAARNVLLDVRQDYLDVFWFIDVEGHSTVNKKNIGNKFHKTKR